jgi:hypothetical protein
MPPPPSYLPLIFNSFYVDLEMKREHYYGAIMQWVAPLQVGV